MRYEFFDHTADVLYKAYGKTVEEAFVNAGLAMTSVMVDYEKVVDKFEHRISVRGSKLETLLYEFLQELIYLVDAEEFLLHAVGSLKIESSGDAYKLEAVVRGDTISSAYETDSAVKSATYSEMYVREEEGRWVAQVVLDI
jgi:SHS2 domain-containing protein